MGQGVGMNPMGMNFGAMGMHPSTGIGMGTGQEMYGNPFLWNALQQAHLQGNYQLLNAIRQACAQRNVCPVMNASTPIGSPYFY
jgi:hypothetical protein